MAGHTDPLGGRQRHRAWLPPETVALIDAMRPDAGDDPRLFRLSAGPDGDCSGQVALRIRRAGRRAGVDGLSGHSPRRGAAHDLLDNGATTAQLLRAGRWSNLATAQRYINEVTRGGDIDADLARSVLAPHGAGRPPPASEPAAEPPPRRRPRLASRTLAAVLD